MDRVIVINLNGNAYQLDEDAYRALRAYLDGAEAQLAGNPDRTEILIDLEQAIAEKCDRYLGAHKTVVLDTEVDQIIKEMGPVDPGTGASGEAGPESPTDAKKAAGEPTGAPKRLYRIREGAMAAGVCNGLAAFFGIDATVARALFALFTIFTGGGGIIAYLVLAFLIPEATTSEEYAAAHGMPFNAKEFVDQAKKSAAGLGKNKDWQRQWRRAMRGHRRAVRFAHRVQREGPFWWKTPGQPPPPSDYTSQMVAGAVTPFVRIANFALFILLVLAVGSLVGNGTALGWALPSGVPLWVGIVGLVVLYSAMVSLLHASMGSLLHATRRATYAVQTPGAPIWLEAWGSLVWLAFVVFAIWFGLQHQAEVERFVANLPPFWDAVREAWIDLIDRISAEAAR